MTLPHWLNAKNLSWFGCLVCLASLSTSKALQSISIGIIGAGALWQIWEAKSLKAFLENRYAWLLSAILILTLVSFFFTENIPQWSRDVKGKVLFCFIPLALGGMLDFSAKQYRGLWLVFMLCQTTVAGISLGRYFANFEQVNEAISKNANIDIIGNMSHIYFGLLLAISVVLGLYLVWRFKPIFSSGERWFIAVLSLINLIFLHILTSRTGLLTFYVGLLSIGLWYSLKNRKIWPIALLGSLMVLAPLLSYKLIPSFKTRVDVTIWDIQQYQPGSQIAADYSLASRIFAWQTALEIFKTNPLIGVGIADIEDEMISRAPEQIQKEKRLSNPHNQYLEYAAAFGILGLCWLALALYLPWNVLQLKNHWLGVAFLVMYATGMVFESLLERQVGICLFCFFIYLLTDFQRIELRGD
ncbi:MAG: O-antigen ligase family protein [Bacteroidota bacterium]